jgi:Ferritin-like domain
MSDKVSELLNRSFPTRRRFLAGLGISAGAAAVVGCGSGSSPSQPVTPPPTGGGTTNPSDADVLNFALNLEYLEAEFYLRAVTGTGLTAADTGASPGATTGGAQVNFTDPAIKAYAMEIAADELAHVQYLRKALGSAAVDKPAIDLMTSFNAAAMAAKIGPTFNPFADQTSFILGAFIFEDVGVTAYNGAVKILLANGSTNGNNLAYLSAAAAIHATEAYHAAEIRTLLVYMDAATPSAGLLATAGKISALRGAASSAGGGLAAEVAPTSKTIVPCDSNSLAFPRTTDQVLDIVYLNATGMAATKGGFYPNGMNGTITASTAASSRNR